MNTSQIFRPLTVVTAFVATWAITGLALAVDCNNNGIEDAEDIAAGTSQDCQPNGVPDECDIAGGAPDDDGNGVPDECDAAPGVGDDTCQTRTTDSVIPCSTDLDCVLPARCGLKSRYITIKPTNDGMGAMTSIRVEIVSMPQFPNRVGETWWAGPEHSLPDPPRPSLRGAQVECTAAPHSQVWTTGDLHLFGYPVVPRSTYGVRMCDPDGGNCSAPLLVGTGKWGDAFREFGEYAQPNLSDLNAIVQTFQNLQSAPIMPRCDLIGAGFAGNPNRVNHVVNMADLSADVDAFSGFPFPYTVPACVP